MKVSLQAVLSDSHLDSTQKSNQRQLAISMSAVSDATDGNLPLNLCFDYRSQRFHEGTTHQQDQTSRC